ncbi:MAG: hypothetical protein ACYC3X_16320, partial [Pirellulaceae bacterium]
QTCVGPDGLESPSHVPAQLLDRRADFLVRQSSGDFHIAAVDVLGQTGKSVLRTGCTPKGHCSLPQPQGE